MTVILALLQILYFLRLIMPPGCKNGFFIKLFRVSYAGSKMLIYFWLTGTSFVGLKRDPAEPTQHTAWIFSF